MQKQYKIRKLFIPIIAASFIIAFTIVLSANNHKPYLELSIYNKSSSFLSFSLSLSRPQHPWWPHLGYLISTGLVATLPTNQIEWLPPLATSPVIKTPYATTLHITTIFPTNFPKDQTIQYIAKLSLIKSNSIEIKREIELSASPTDKQQNFYLYNSKNNMIVTCEEWTKFLISEAEKEIQKIPYQSLPQKIALYAGFGRAALKDVSDEYLTLQSQLFKKIGINGIGFAEGECLMKLNLPFHKGSTVLPQEPWQKKWKKEDYQQNVLHILGYYQYRNLINKVRFMIMGDEISSGTFEDFIEHQNARGVVEKYLKAQAVAIPQTAEKSISLYLPHGLMRAKEPMLYYFAHQARMAEWAELFKNACNETLRFFPNVLISPNWPVATYYNGGVDGQGWDLWHIYRQKALNALWSEDWWGRDKHYIILGLADFLADAMRSQANGLPLGIYNIAESDVTPLELHVKTYSQISRGIWDIEFYAYGPAINANEGLPWELKPEIIKELCHIARELAEVEPFLLNSSPEKAKVALLWTTPQQIWLPEHYNEFKALYFALLHNNINFDIISQYDIEDKSLTNYSALYMPFSYITLAAWNEIKHWVKKGGCLIMEGYQLKDEFNRIIPLDDFLPEYGIKPYFDSRHRIGELSIDLPSYPQIDRTVPADIPIIYDKCKIIAPQDVEVILQFTNNTPAMIKIEKEAGKVFIFGFFMGLSYIWDHHQRAKTSWNERKIAPFFSSEMSHYLTLPLNESTISYRTCGITNELLVARRWSSKKYDVVFLWDYSYGAANTLIPPHWENIKERTCTVKLEKEPLNARALRGKIEKIDKNGANSKIELKMKAIDILIVEY